MSYILDALKKAEQERGIGQVPRLASVQEEPPRPRRGLAWLIGGALLLNALVLGWWLRPVTTPKVAPRPAHTTGAPATPTAATQPETNAAVRSVPRVAASSPSAPLPATRITPPAVAGEPPISKQATYAGARKRVAPSVPPLRESSIETRAVPKAPEPAVSSVPLLRDMPADFRAGVPPLNLDVHVYAAANAGRFVLINMKKYHEGDQLAEGPRLEEITPDGVILNYQGQQFRIARQ